jgi:hypothetical protein
MPRPKKTNAKSARGAREPLRIVPLHHPELLTQAPSGASPQLTYRGGPLLANVEVVTLFWGAAWNQSPTQDLITPINSFFNLILSSTLIDQLSEYSAGAYQIGPGKWISTFTFTSPALGQSLTDAKLRELLQAQISGSTVFPQPNANRLYFNFLPPGVTIIQSGARSCQAFCGYHDTINGTLFYAVMPYPNCAGCTGGLAPLDALTSTSSHELCESITDPIPGQGWYDDANGEIGDICAWKTKKLGDYTVQLEWSNKANACQ